MGGLPGDAGNKVEVLVAVQHGERGRKSGRSLHEVSADVVLAASRVTTDPPEQPGARTTPVADLDRWRRVSR